MSDMEQARRAIATEEYKAERDVILGLAVEKFLLTLAKPVSGLDICEGLAEILFETYMLGATHGFKAAAK